MDSKKYHTLKTPAVSSGFMLLFRTAGEKAEAQNLSRTPSFLLSYLSPNV